MTEIWRQLQAIARDDFPVVPILVIAGVGWWVWWSERREQRRAWGEWKRRGFEVKGKGK